jgi:hypothetical protein
MSEERFMNPSRYFKDNKLIDFVAAILTGLGVWWLIFSATHSFLRPSVLNAEEIRSMSVKVGSFSLAALILFLWKRKPRAQWGWIPIAILGMIITSVIDEIIYRATATAEELNFMPAFSAFPLEIIIWLGPALVFMGIAHYIGLLITFRERRLP